jgi:hypothetical protein
MAFPMQKDTTYSDYMETIKKTGKDIWNDDDECSYTPYLVQRGLFSDDPNAIKLLNIANQRIKDKKLHYHWLLHTMSKKVTYVSQSKRKKDILVKKYLSSVKKVYGYNDKKAMSAIDILSIEQLEQIASSLSQGGTSR